MDRLLEQLTRRDLATRSATHDDPVIARALEVLGQRVSPVRPVTPEEIRAIYAEQGEGKRDVDGIVGFRRPHDLNDPALYINSGSQIYRDARNPDNALAQVLLAATIAHENIHNTERGPEGEMAARRIESDFLRSRIDSLPQWQKKDALKRLRTLDMLAANRR